MSHFRKIDVRIWNDAKFASLNDEGKLVFLTMLTHPSMTALGAMRCSMEGLLSELKGNREALADGFRDIIRHGMAEYDADARMIALPNFLKYNPPTAPNTVKAWARQLEYLPECQLKTVVIQRAVAFTHGMADAFQHAIPDAMRYTQSIEHGDYPNQGEELAGYGATGRRKPLALADGSGAEVGP